MRARHSGPRGPTSPGRGDCTIGCKPHRWARDCRREAIPSERCAWELVGRQSPARATAGVGSARRRGPDGCAVDGRKLEHEPGSAFARRGGETAAVIFGDRGGDRESPPPAATAPARPSRELRHGGAQAGTMVEDLDPDASTPRASANGDRPASVLDRVRDQIPRGLREPAAIAFCELWQEFRKAPVSFQASKHAQMRAYMSELGLTMSS